MNVIIFGSKPAVMHNFGSAISTSKFWFFTQKCTVQAEPPQVSSHLPVSSLQQKVEPDFCPQGSQLGVTGNE